MQKRCPAYGRTAVSNGQAVPSYWKTVILYGLTMDIYGEATIIDGESSPSKGTQAGYPKSENGSLRNTQKTRK